MSTDWNLWDSNVEQAAKDLAGNWHTFQSFGWSDKPACADECAIVYLSTRDSEALEKSNEASILAALKPYLGWIDGDDDDCEQQSHNHWAVGYVDGIVIRCTRDGQVTPAFRVLHALAMRLADYPILDEEDFSRREYEEDEYEEEKSE